MNTRYFQRPNTSHVATAPNCVNARGFTLVELLVVIAIIGILAGIVVPQVSQYIRRSKIARAHAEIRNADSSLSAMLADAKRGSFAHFLDGDGRTAIAGFHDAQGTLVAYQAAQNFYNNIFYALLRQGKNITQTDPDWAHYLNPEALDKLGTGYLDLGLDPWGHQYNFWMGPQPRGDIFHRSYRGENYYWNPSRDSEKLPGQERRDVQDYPGGPAGAGLPGKPAPRNMSVYIYSSGPNELIDAHVMASLLYNNDRAFIGGGDDINNWDSEAGWEEAPQT